MNSAYLDHSTEALGRSALEEIQLKKLQLNLAGILATNPFYQGKLGASGIENASDSCLTFGVVGQAICRQPNRYLFWDAAHPTRAGHAALAEAARELLTGP